MWFEGVGMRSFIASDVIMKYAKFFPWPVAFFFFFFFFFFFCFVFFFFFFFFFFLCVCVCEVRSSSLMCPSAKLHYMCICFIH